MMDFGLNGFVEKLINAHQVHWETMTEAVRPVLTVRPAVLNCSLLKLEPCERERGNARHTAERGFEKKETTERNLREHDGWVRSPRTNNGALRIGLAGRG